MKKTFAFACAILSLTISHAQLELVSDQLQTGIHFNLYNLTDVNTDNLMPIGSGVTWDLAATTATLAGDADFLEMSDTPFGAVYPEANFAIRLSFTSMPVTYSLFHLSATELVEVANNVGTIDEVSFINPRQTLVFSFELYSTVFDVYQKEGQLEKTTSNVYDGDGTFLTNDGSYGNIMRIFTDDDGNTSYAWWTTSPITPLFLASANSFVLWDATTPTSVMDATENDVFEMFPNPATNEIRIMNKSRITGIDILDLSGQHLFSTNQSIIDVSGLAAGVYVIRANTTSGSAVERFVKMN